MYGSDCKHKVLNVFNCKPPWKMEHSMFAGVEECTKELR